MKFITVQNVNEYELSFPMINKLWEEDMEMAQTESIKQAEQIDKLNAETYNESVANNAGKYLKKAPKKSTVSDKDIEYIAVTKGKLKKYLEKRIYPSRDGGYFIIESGHAVLKSKDAFIKIEKKIRHKSKLLYATVIDDCDDLYTADVFPEDYIIDLKKHRINMSKRFNFSYDPDAKVDKINGQKILDFIKEIIVSNNEDEWKCLCFVIGCMAKRKRSEIVLFLTGLEGIGKTFFCNILRGLFGKSFANTSEATLSGDNQFNMMMVGSVVACLEETSGGADYRKVMKGIKEIATSETLFARKMHVDGFDVMNMINIIVLSNFFRDIDMSNRKVFGPTLNPKYQNNHDFFGNLKTLMTTESLQYVFNYFYDIDCTKQVRIPETQGKQDSKITNLPNPIKFLLDQYIIRKPQEVCEKKMRQLYTEFESYCTSNEIKAIAKFDQFSHTIRNYIPFVEKDGKPKLRDKTNIYDISLNTLIDRLVKRSKVITQEQIDELILEHEQGKNDKVYLQDNEESLYVEDIKRLNIIIKEQSNEIEELKAKLAQLENSQKKVEIPEVEKKVTRKKVTNEAVKDYEGLLELEFS